MEYYIDWGLGQYSLLTALLFPADNSDGCIDVKKYHTHGIEGLGSLPENLEGGICLHGLCPLQSSKKKLEKNAKAGVWMAPVCKLP